MARSNYSWNVFINVPFDDQYSLLRSALVFAIYDCGFVPRCSLEEDNGGNVRFGKILALISESRFAVHDISRTELDPVNGLPRFNMPLELGVFIGAKEFGGSRHKTKNCLVLDIERYRYQKFLSDIAGHDIYAHANDAKKLIGCVRDWLNVASEGKPMPGGRAIFNRFEKFRAQLPAMCDAIPIGEDELTYVDFNHFIEAWLRENT